VVDLWFQVNQSDWQNGKLKKCCRTEHPELSFLFFWLDEWPVYGEYWRRPVWHHLHRHPFSPRKRRNLVPSPFRGQTPTTRQPPGAKCQYYNKKFFVTDGGSKVFVTIILFRLVLFLLLRTKLVIYFFRPKFKYIPEWAPLPYSMANFSILVWNLVSMPWKQWHNTLNYFACQRRRKQFYNIDNRSNSKAFTRSTLQTRSLASTWKLLKLMDRSGIHKESLSNGTLFTKLAMGIWR